MYGRCETDPFDQATDVCDSCYGEFCSACMVKTKGRKHPICKDCAIIASGVRPGAKPLLRGSKKTAPERRKTLQDAPTAARSFEYFDDKATDGDRPSVADQPTVDDRSTVGEPESETVAPAGSEPVALDGVDGVDDPAGHESGDQPVPQPGQTGSRASISPGLAALAKHQAEQQVAPVAPESVPAPAWLTESIDGSETPPPSGLDRDAATPSPEVATPPAPTEATDRGRAQEKPVTDGFEWVTKMPPRGSTAPLPSRSGNGRGPEHPQEAGAVATADRPPAALPHRRSKRRPDNGDT